MATDPRIALRLGAEVGEAPFWDQGTATLMAVDITGGVVHLLSPSGGEQRAFEVGQPVGAAVMRAGGGAMLALRDGFATLDLTSGVVELVAEVERDQPTRMNDAKCDRAGRLWAGTTAFDNAPGAGTLYRFDPGGAVTPMLEGVTLSNGLGWSPDDRTMYYIDSMTQRVDAFDFDALTGAIERRRPFVAITPEDGLPDGLCVDADGFVWVALWGGWELRRYAPDGVQERAIELPARLVTCCAFGGAELSDLFITTATHELSERELAQQPGAGDVFVVTPGPRGMPSRPFAG